eukprot:TRINITY_DN13449_c0_g1_i1.p1 TRINITY_DN13449_c0_g1~~TRINITY_DN13449_c0_g1_i1.p1  ORF type:complete len:90 (+),score=7.83 TRINITY_DN13449_c0_g1_i1:1-270(+)
MGDTEFLDSFLNATIPFEQWTHRAHLKMAYLVIQKYQPDFDTAIKVIRSGIKNFNSRHLEKLTVGYHETITLFVSFVCFVVVQDYLMKP